MRQTHSIVKGVAGCHERRGSQHTFAVSMYDSRVDITSKAEVVGVDDQTLQS